MTFVRRRVGRLLRRDERGYAAVLVAVFVAVVALPLCAVGVDTSRWYLEQQRAQNAADAAALAGVTHLPDDFNGARTEALDVAADNGYTDGGRTTITVAVGAKPTQLKVTITTDLANVFGGSIGVSSTKITGSATADFSGVTPMGSPCNTFGNQPPGTPSNGPVASALTVPDTDAQCTDDPQMWAAISGPDWPKAAGDQMMTRYCSWGSGCDANGKNTDFNPLGYFYIVHANAAAVGQPVRFQIYDPALTTSGDICNATPTGTISSDNWNPYASTDAKARYAMSINKYCAPDAWSGVRFSTTFSLRAPTVTLNPVDGAPVAGCAKQYPSYTPTEVTAATLQKGNPAYNDGLAKVFRQWVTLCTFTPTRVGDYYLQIRTNVKPPSDAPGAGGIYNNLDATGAFADTSYAQKSYTQMGDDLNVHGSSDNRFAMRIADAPAGSMSISGYQAMSIMANYPGAATTFNLVRVVPAAASKTLTLKFFDTGDGNGSGTLTILPPQDSNLSPSAMTCRALGDVVTGTLSNCQLSGISSSTFNSMAQVVSIKIPSNYTCHSTNAGGCWFRLVFAFPNASPNDTTTWSASIQGDPVRLIE